MSNVATLPAESRYSKLSYLTCAVLIWFHIQAVAALWSFSWTNLFVAVFLYWVAIGLGISMGYHRLHTHRGFKTYRLLEYFLAVCGTLTLEGGRIVWVAPPRPHPPPPPPAPRPGAASPHPAGERLPASPGLDHLRRGATQRHRADVEIRA